LDAEVRKGVRISLDDPEFRKLLEKARAAIEAGTLPATVDGIRPDLHVESLRPGPCVLCQQNLASEPHWYRLTYNSGEHAADDVKRVLHGSCYSVWYFEARRRDADRMNYETLSELQAHAAAQALTAALEQATVTHTDEDGLLTVRVVKNAGDAGTLIVEWSAKFENRAKAIALIDHAIRVAQCAGAPR
jgi:hypothetical protein